MSNPAAALDKITRDVITSCGPITARQQVTRRCPHCGEAIAIRRWFVYPGEVVGPPEDLVRDCLRCSPPPPRAEPFDPIAVIDALLAEAAARREGEKT